MASILSAVLEETEIGDEAIGRSIDNETSIGSSKSLLQELYKIDVQRNDEKDFMKRPDHRLVWKEIEDEFESKRKAIREYKQSKNLIADLSSSPDVDYLNKTVFPLLLKILEETLVKANELNCLKYQKSRFNGIDYIAEMLWNRNPKHPERHRKHVYIFNTEWVKDWLKQNPRPFFPFSYIWSRDFAATKIQAAVRGYWVRRTEAVQEMRQFWKALADEREMINKSLQDVNNQPVIE